MVAKLVTVWLAVVVAVEILKAVAVAIAVSVEVAVAVSVAIAVKVWTTVTVVLFTFSRIDEGIAVELATLAIMAETLVDKNPLSIESSLWIPAKHEGHPTGATLVATAEVVEVAVMGQAGWEADDVTPQANSDDTDDSMEAMEVGFMLASWVALDNWLLMSDGRAVTLPLAMAEAIAVGTVPLLIAEAAALGTVPLEIAELMALGTVPLLTAEAIILEAEPLAIALWTAVGKALALAIIEATLVGKALEALALAKIDEACPNARDE